LEIDPPDNAKRKGELILVFGSGPLGEHTYRPLGINALWALIGAIASLNEGFYFEIKPSMTAAGIAGGFAKEEFCLFDVSADHNLVVFTARAVDHSGARKVTIHDLGHAMFFWIPRSAMMPFEDLIKVGNSLLLSMGSHCRSLVGQYYKNWENGRYTPHPAW
jgi:hypothetical protein